MAKRVGLVLQNPATQLFAGTVAEEVAFGPRNLGFPPREITARARAALEATGCVHLQDRPVRHLSSGEQRRVAIAAVLAMRPNALILDEPTANLDEDGVRLLVQTLVHLQRQVPVTLIVIEHRLEPFLPYADRLVWMVGGRVVADGEPGETLARMQPVPAVPRSSWAESVQPLVSLEGVIAGYDRRPVLQDCSFVLNQGEFAALVGPNGSGKTTLARVLAGLLRPRRGRVVWHSDGNRWRLGLLQQNPLHQLVCDTVEEEVAFGPRNLGTGRVCDVEAWVGTVLRETGLQEIHQRPTQALSVGQQQRTALAATLGLLPDLLILDEPTVGQDWGHLFRMMDFLSDLNRAGQAVLLITHERRLVERYASRVWKMVGGRLDEVAGAKQEAGSRQQVAESSRGVQVRGAAGSVS
jgi:energy-coupling factor transport system ATP-binding protein